MTKTYSYAEGCQVVDQRSSRRCERCGRAVQVGGNHHHRKLRSRGGDDSPANVAFLCGSGTTGCHGWVHANPAQATAEGWMVGTNADPAAVAITTSRYGDRVYFGADGELYGVPADECAIATRAARLATTKWPSTYDTTGAMR